MRELLAGGVSEPQDDLKEGKALLSRVMSESNALSSLSVSQLRSTTCTRA